MARTTSPGGEREMDGVEKAATLLITLGPEKSAKIFKHLKEEEIEQLKAVGGKTMSLGKRILRTETAGMTVLSILMFTIEE